MKNICLIIEYDGTRYSGWQRQKNTSNTIESKISNILKLMQCSDEDIEIHGSGRTDAGVHANWQVANVNLDTNKSPSDIKEYLNMHLPEDIRIVNAYEVGSRFHARLSAINKEYEYTIDNSNKANVFLRKYAWNIIEELDVKQMRKAAKIFVGKHDFLSFSDMKKSKKSSIREIYQIDISVEEINHNKIIKISYKGDGFLYHMVRRITAAIVEAGAGRITEEELAVMLDSKGEKRIKLMAPAKGLRLMQVGYKDIR